MLLKIRSCYVVISRAATNIQFVWIFVRILVFGFDLFAFGIRLHGIYVKITIFGASRPVL